MPVLDLEVLETGFKLISGEIERAEVKGQSKEEQRSVFEKGVKTNPIFFATCSQLVRNDAKTMLCSRSRWTSVKRYDRRKKEKSKQISLQKKFVRREKKRRHLEERIIYVVREIV